MVFFVLGLAVTYTFGRFSKNITMSHLIANQNLLLSAYHLRASAFFLFFIFIYNTLARTVAQKATYKYLQCSSNIEKITTFDT